MEQMDRYHPNTYVTPVPGGVGLCTRLALLENTIDAFKKQNN
jgi:methylenetetrahydrofolate dehydrogenase (NADP+)/methenyltetrahydrofolate cyclohydrolase